MGNPYAPRVSRTASVPETPSELASFVHRLQMLGATPEELAVVGDTWDDLDDDWTAEQRSALTRLSDDELRAELRATREEYRHDTRTEGEQEALDATGYVEQMRAQAAEEVKKPVPQVLAWVDDDPVRAIAVLDLENGPDGAQRKTLVEPLQELVAGDDPEGIEVEVLGEPLPPADDTEKVGEAIDGERTEVEGDELDGADDSG